MKKNGAIFTILTCCFGLISLFVAIFCIQSKGYLQYYGTAVDSKGNVYIGTNYGIDVYNNKSEMLYTIKPVPKGYAFTIHNDVIYEKDYMQYVSACTLAGEEIELLYYADNPDLPEYMQYSALDKKRFISDEGDEYRLKIKGIHLCVIKNGDTVIFRESSVPAILRLILKISIALTVLSFGGTASVSFYLKRKH